MQAASSGNLPCLYIGRFIEGLGLGAATMLTPTYISENAPRAVRGMLVGLYQLFETMGAMVAFWINCTTNETFFFGGYGCIINVWQMVLYSTSAATDNGKYPWQCNACLLSSSSSECSSATNHRDG